MLLEAAIGDAYGGCFEWGLEPHEITPFNNLTYQAVQPGLIPPGNYTDDTQMMLAIVEALLADDLNRLSLADRFVECYRRDERRGYTTAFQCLLMNSYSGKELLSKIGGQSDRSGSAMRAAPIGFIANLDELKLASDTQANVTHNSVAGREAALATALMSHYFIYNLGMVQDLDSWLKGFQWENDIFSAWELGTKVDVKGISCVRAAKTAILNNNTLSGILKTSVAFGGDTDTVACIALSIASMSKEITNDLPQNLYEGLENKAFGKDYLIELDKKLLAKYR
jgi:ADP-ribosyl-[dinitrogen reductase] hydrolase